MKADARGYYRVTQLRQIEQEAKAQGLALMPRAARAAVDFVQTRFGSAARILVLAGPGNNGGDAVLAAHYLKQAGYSVQLCMPQRDELPTDAADAYRQWREGRGDEITQWPESPPTLVIDGLFGIGANRPLGEPWQTLIRQANALQRPILALDVPSGIAADTGAALGETIRARWTLSFIGRARGLATGAACDAVGESHLHTLDLPPSLLAAGDITTTSMEQQAIPLRRRHDSHKGSFGSVAILGGAGGMIGAPLLAGRAALSSGAGKVWVGLLTPGPSVDPVRPELMLAAANEQTIQRADILAIGPGLGLSSSARTLLQAAIASNKPLVMDADALNMLASDSDLQQQLLQRHAATLLTPHPAEAARLLACTSADIQNNRYAAATELAQACRALVVLKGAGSLVVQGERIAINQTGSAALANAGQGDVLSGVLAGLLAQGLDSWQAANLAVWAHGAASDRLCARDGRLVTLAADVTSEIANCLGNR